MKATCDFSTNFTGAYVCTVEAISGISRAKEIKLNGKHKEGKTHNDVTLLDAEDIPLRFVPKNLLKQFPNLKCLSFYGCGIDELSRDDLKGLENLEYIDFAGNKLTALPDDLFADTTKVRFLYFNDNKLEWMSSKILIPIKSSLELADFGANTKIDNYFDLKNQNINPYIRICNTFAFASKTDTNNLEMFMKIIDSKFWDPQDVSRIEKLFSGQGQ